MIDVFKMAIRKIWKKRIINFQKLAKMLEEGPDAPKRAKKKRVIKTYLVSQVVGPRMMGAFKEAYRKYEKDMAGN